MFIAIAKVCRREQVSCLFESTEESDQTRQALETKIPTICLIWRLNEKSHISIQDTYFVTKKEIKERVKNDLLM